ncbi:protein INVOLVED IN DE NOVO 2-like [Nymphaea colorata]|uniref:protein INVOLVED IN DE NOVO 2-like n=1 Tax=Nymphaea colorata TaxID=210225 RepID=UPI00129E8B5A|nr:protein INVOLVED IN DE NOVO 2-like [Nymphaea colorata]
MSSDSDDYSDFSEGEIEERAEKLYKALREKNVFTGSSDGFLRCPYCLGKKKQDYKYKDLLQHATGVGNSNKRLKETVKHRALAKFLQLDFIEKSAPSVTHSFPRSAPPSKRFKKDAQEERFVWPWMGIVVNIQARGKDGKHFATASRLKEEFAWFNPIRVYPLWDYNGFRGTAIIEFNRLWSGYHSANSFERSFQVDHHGKKEWVEFRGHGSSMYGWMAREDDYNSTDRCIREHLRKHGELRTVTELEDEEKRKKNILVDGLKQQIDLKNKDLESSGMRLKEVTYVLQQTKASLEEGIAVHPEQKKPPPALLDIGDGSDAAQTSSKDVEQGVKYDDELSSMLRIAAEAKCLTATDRFGILDDSYALCRASKQSLSSLLILMDAYRDELDYTVLSCLINTQTQSGFALPKPAVVVLNLLDDGTNIGNEGVTEGASFSTKSNCKNFVSAPCLAVSFNLLLEFLTLVAC